MRVLSLLPQSYAVQLRHGRRTCGKHDGNATVVASEYT